jgi:diaminopimelate decarboxylase
VNNKIIPSSSLGYLDNRLHFHHTPIQEAIGKISTPFYLYSKNAIQDNLTYFRNCAREEFSNVKVHYAMKANSNAEILKLLASLDAGADIVSLGEYKLATNSGIAPSQILFSGVGKTEHEIEYIISHSDNGIKSFNVESLDELELLQEISKKYGKVTNIAFRLNPNVSAMTHKHISTGGSMHKFGMSSAEIQIALAQNFSNLKLIGLSIHIGSQLKNFDATKAAIEEMLDIINKNNLHELDFLDFGGGLGIFYGPHDKDLSSAPEYFANISRLIKPFYLNRKCPEIIFEPGRFITGNAGILVTKVIRIKDNGVKSFAILDAGMTELIRPALYDAYHEILPLRREQTSGGDKKKYDFVGPVCETGDYFARDRESSIFDKNDLFAIGNCGSYARSMASTYNTREIPAEYFIEDIIK